MARGVKEVCRERVDSCDEGEGGLRVEDVEVLEAGVAYLLDIRGRYWNRCLNAPTYISIKDCVDPLDR